MVQPIWIFSLLNALPPHCFCSFSSMYCECCCNRLFTVGRSFVNDMLDNIYIPIQWSFFIRSINRVSSVDGSIKRRCGRITRFTLLNRSSQILEVGLTWRVEWYWAMFFRHTNTQTNTQTYNHAYIHKVFVCARERILIFILYKNTHIIQVY